MNNQIKIKEITIRKARRSTVKSPTGNYDMNEADVSLTVEAEEGKLDTQDVINRVKALVDETLDNTPDPVDPDPSWINERQVNEPNKEKMPWEKDVRKSL